MKVFIKGKGEISLTKNDFIAAGGEGSVYAKNGIAYKIYNDKSKMIPLGKIQELSIVKNKNIIKPENIILDEKNNVIGYTMRFVSDTYALCQVFPKAFRQREGMTHQQSFNLVRKMQDLMKELHDNKILCVDFNEMNILCDNTFSDVYLIDVDSVQTPSFPATALMESVRDRHSNGTFNEGTDWFAFGITSFQTLIGIHPYKGKHASIKDIDERMKRNISVLNKDVSVPPVCYDFSVIPSNYLKWYEAIFEHGKRVAPPFGNEVLQLIVQKIQTITGNNKFDIKELKDFYSNVKILYNCVGIELVVTEKCVYLNNKELNNDNYFWCSISAKKNIPIFGKIKNKTLNLINAITLQDIPCNVETDQIVSYNNTLYIKSGESICIVEFVETGTNVIATFKKIANVMPNSTKLYEGVAIQNMLSSWYASVFPKAGHCYNINLKELQQYSKIIDAKK